MIELLRKRRSIRKYRDKRIEPEKVELLKEAMLRSPSSRGRNPWRFIFVDKKSLLKKLSKSKPHGGLFLQEAALGIVVCGNSEKSDAWIEDCSIGSIIAQLQAEDLGLGSCWIQIRGRKHDEKLSAEDYIKKLLNIPEKFSVESIISIGHPDEEKNIIPRNELEYNKIIENKFK